MGLLEVTLRLVAGVAVLLAAAGFVFVDADRVAATLRDPLRRPREVSRQVGVLLVVLLVNRAFRHLGQELSWIIGWNVTGVVFALEGTFVAGVQRLASPPLTALLSFAYLYGYAFLVSFPVVAYWVLDDPGPLRKTLIAYAANYGLGLLCYTLVIAYGPRNLLPESVKALLYTTYPQTQLLTSTINANTNVFPSLHTSLSVTAALLAARTRDVYPGWYRLALPLAALIVVSTMYLGIHWATDVVAGVVLAVVSVRLADRYHRPPGSGWRPWRASDTTRE